MSPVLKAWQDIIMQETAGGVPAVPDQQKKNFVWSYYPGVEENVADRVSRLGNGVLRGCSSGPVTKQKVVMGRLPLGRYGNSCMKT